jgi:DNA-binding beta-propeller fold protein YncE
MGFSDTDGAGADRKPHQLAIDLSGDVFLTDRADSEVLKFNNNGKFVEKWGSNGSGNKQFIKPHGIAFDSRLGG